MVEKVVEILVKTRGKTSSKHVFLFIPTANLLKTSAWFPLQSDEISTIEKYLISLLKPRKDHDKVASTFLAFLDEQN